MNTEMTRNEAAKKWWELHQKFNLRVREKRELFDKWRKAQQELNQLYLELNDLEAKYDLEDDAILEYHKPEGAEW